MHDKTITHIGSTNNFKGTTKLELDENINI
jgi:hypothetical protein